MQDAHDDQNPETNKQTKKLNTISQVWWSTASLNPCTCEVGKDKEFRQHLPSKKKKA